MNAPKRCGRGWSGFRAVPGRPHYFVNRAGDVWSEPRMVAGNEGLRPVGGRFLSWSTAGGDGPHVRVKVGGDWMSLASVLLLAFVGPRPAGARAWHLNGDWLDHRLENLGWLSRSDGMARTMVRYCARRDMKRAGVKNPPVSFHFKPEGGPMPERNDGTDMTRIRRAALDRLRALRESTKHSQLDILDALILTPSGSEVSDAVNERRIRQARAAMGAAS